MFKKTVYVVTVLALTVGLALSQDKGKGGGPPGGGGGKGGQAKGPGMALSSPDFPDGGIIPDKFTQAAGPTSPSPKLEWTNVPAGTVSFALIMHDPDVAIGGPEDVLHWMAFNIPGTAKGLDGGVATTATLPDGTIQAKNRGGNAGYMGPGNGAINPYHHYTLELYALNTTLMLGADATREDLLKAMVGKTTGKAVLVGRFKRPN